GHGGSPLDGSLRRVRIDHYIDDVADAISHMPAPPILIGHSMGGLVVQRYLEQHNAPGAVLVAPVPVGGAWMATLGVIRRHPIAFLKAVGTLRMWPIVSDADRARSLFLAADLPKDDADRFVGLLQDESFLAYTEMLTIRMPRPDRVDTPTLVVAAGADALFSVKQQEKTAAGYGGSPVIIAGAGHDLMLDPAWETAAVAIAEWIDGIE
ncbi:alpha/beta fold hydrolase, partial [bacterium]|nr:alpha/beta fold hydrolase [bacterium]